MKLPLDDMENLLGHPKHSHKHHHHKEKEDKKDEDKEDKDWEEKEDKDIPEDWKERCPKHEDWCDKFLLKMIKEKKVHELFDGVKEPKLKAEDKELIKRACKSKKYHKKKWCPKVKELELKLWDDRSKLEEHSKRAANEEAEDGGSGSLAIGLTVGGLFLFFLILGIVLYVYVYKSGKKERAGKTGSIAKGGSKLKSRRSKSGKSGVKSRLASKSSGKKSHGSRKTAKKSSKNLGSKKSVNKK